MTTTTAPAPTTLVPGVAYRTGDLLVCAHDACGGITTLDDRGLRPVAGRDVIDLAQPGQPLTCRCGRLAVAYSMRAGLRTEVVPMVAAIDELYARLDAATSEAERLDLMRQIADMPIPREGELNELRERTRAATDLDERRALMRAAAAIPDPRIPPITASKADAILRVMLDGPELRQAMKDAGCWDVEPIEDYDITLNLNTGHRLLDVDVVRRISVRDADSACEALGVIDELIEHLGGVHSHICRRYGIG